jgi:hypothetical protein
MSQWWPAARSVQEALLQPAKNHWSRLSDRLMSWPVPEVTRRDLGAGDRIEQRRSANGQQARQGDQPEGR